MFFKYVCLRVFYWILNSFVGWFFFAAAAAAAGPRFALILWSERNGGKEKKRNSQWKTSSPSTRAASVELKRSLARWSDQIRTSWKQAKKNMLLFILRSSLSFLFAISMLWSITFLWVHLLVAARKIEPCMFFDCVKFQHYDLQRMQRNIIQINLK